MKKFFLIMPLVALASLVVFISCNDDKTEELPVPKSKQELSEKLTQFNQSYLKQIEADTPIQTRGFWKGLGDVLEVAGADIIGAGAGAVAVGEVATVVGAATGGTGFAVVAGTAAVVAGAGASVGAARLLDNSSVAIDEKEVETRSSSRNNLGTQLYLSNLDIKYGEKYAHLANIGKEHNRTVVKMNAIATRGANDYNEIEKALLENKEFTAKREEIEKVVVEYIKAGGDVKVLLQGLKEKEFISDKMSFVYSFFFDIYNKSVNFDNVEDIVNFYIKSIEESDFLSEKEKEALIASFSVASESPVLWYNQK